MTYRQQRYLERGATAMIVVLFSILLFTVIAVGFMSLMVQDQRASSDTELSRGAYDAALAGVEDGKRVLQMCLDGDTTACDELKKMKCSIVSDVGIAQVDAQGEIYMKSIVSSGSTGLDYQQAYTCVKVQQNTNDYLGSLLADKSLVMPLKTVSEFNKIKIMWFMRSNANSDTVKLTTDASTLLTNAADWNNATSPPILRLQLMQYQDGALDVANFDNNGGAHTVYLYPKKLLPVDQSFANDSRRSGMLTPLVASCNTTFLGGGYACSATVDLPPPPSGGDISKRVAYLRITSLYGAADLSVSAYRDSIPVEFDGVQPIVDSTGRAADVFRRVSARVDKADSLAEMLYPRATVDVTGNFCKTFVVGALASNYDTGTCLP